MVHIVQNIKMGVSFCNIVSILHCRNELELRQRQAKEEKRKLRSRLKKFEVDFQTTTGRPPQKEEKYYSAEMELEYQKYKRLRATLRLLEVLITKRNFPQLNNKRED